MNLNQAYEEGKTHVYHSPIVLDNRFKWLMENDFSWEKVSGIGGLGFEKLEISPHYWNKKVMALVAYQTRQQIQSYLDVGYAMAAKRE